MPVRPGSMGKPVPGWTVDVLDEAGQRAADGYLWFEGRDDDVITSSAYRIGPFEVDSALVEHPAVVEAAVVGKDDPSGQPASVVLEL